MKTAALRINQLSDEAYRWYLDYLSALDAKDIDAYGRYLADDVALVMNNAEPVQGKPEVSAGLAAYWQTFGELEHELQNIYGSDRLAEVAAALEHRSALAREQLVQVTARYLVQVEAGLGGQLGHVPEHVPELGGQRLATLLGEHATVVADRLLDLLGRLARLAAQAERRVGEVRAGVGIYGGGARALLVVGQPHATNLAGNAEGTLMNGWGMPMLCVWKSIPPRPSKGSPLG